MRATRDLEPFNGVAATGKAVMTTTNLLGNTFEQVALTLGGGSLTKAMLSRIVVKLNQKPIWDLTGDQLNSINLYNAHPTIASMLSLYFSEPRATTRRAKLSGAIDTSFGVNGLTFEVDIAGATTPTLAAQAKISPPLSQDRDDGIKALAPLVRCLLPTPLPLTSAVTRAPQTINLGSVAGAIVKRLYIFHTNLTEVGFKRDGVDLVESLTVTENSFFLDELGHDPAAGLFVLDFIEDDDLDNALPTLRSNGSVANNQLLVTTSGADTLTVIADVLASPALL